MRQFVWAWMLLGGAVAVIPGPVDAQIFRRPLRGCCETCEMPHSNCTCTQTRPVVQTQLRAQQVTTFRDVTETHVRNETVVQNVPVTTFKQVTVDEGAYQMVWVPKPVTKQVAQTVIQQQAQTRAVPYQVTRRVPHPLYKRIVTKRNKFYAHDEESTAKVGDIVKIIESRPLSKMKRWVLGEIVRRAVDTSVIVVAAK